MKPIIFTHIQFGRIRVTQNEKGDPYFAANDICNALGYSNPRDAVSKHIDSEDVVKCDTPTKGGMQEITFINESGLYSLIFGSKLTAAKDFKRWVTSEVLPSIRKSGGYIVTREEDTPEMIVAKAMQITAATLERHKLLLQEKTREAELLNERLEKANETLIQVAPKVEYYHAVLQSVSTYTTTQIAKELGTSAVRLNKFLEQEKVQYKQSGQWLLYAKFQDCGYTKTRTFVRVNERGEAVTYLETVWTERGRKAIHKKWHTLNPITV